jgi:allantoicase
MDGWESRRRRIPGNDHCIVRLGTKGVISGINIDTKFFTGNHPPQGSLEATFSDSDPDENTKWTEILPISDLTADSNNFFPISSKVPFNHLRFNIFPDGGVARLRVYGSPVGEWKSTDPDGLQELSAVVNGGNIIGFNDAHYGDPWVILAPGRGTNMGDGWETRRRREPGNDWIVISLGASGIVKRIELDTAHFKGNYPDSCSVQAALITKTSAENMLTDECHWPELMAKQKLEMDKIHNFDGNLINKIGEVSHLRLNIFPDGGVSRFRIFGSLSSNDT